LDFYEQSGMRQEQRLRTTGDAATYLLDGIAQSGGPREQKGAKRSKKGGHILTKNISFAETETGGQAIIRDRGKPDPSPQNFR
jgi:hypothetical protein